MGLPNINISLTNGNLGLLAVADTVVGMVLQGVALANLSLETPYRLTSLDDAKALGLSSSYDSSYASTAYKHIADFYSIAPKGTVLWVMVIAQNVTMTQMATHASMRTLLDGASEIGILVITRSPQSGYTPTIANGMDADVMTAVAAFQTLANSEAIAYRPFRVIIESRHVNYAQLSTLQSLNTFNYNRVSVLVGDTSATNFKGAAVGLLAGRLASIPVQRNIARVRDGAIAQAVYFGSASDTPKTKSGYAPILHDKGYITFRFHVGRGGYYFTDDPTATLVTDDYSSLSRGRVMDKVLRIAYDVYLNYLIDEIVINPQNGQMETATAKGWQTAAKSAIDAQMTANNEISTSTVFVDPSQNVVSSNKVKIAIAILPVGYAKVIDVEIGFSNPANQ